MLKQAEDAFYANHHSVTGVFPYLVPLVKVSPRCLLLSDRSAEILAYVLLVAVPAKLDERLVDAHATLDQWSGTLCSHCAPDKPHRHLWQKRLLFVPRLSPNDDWFDPADR